MFLKDYAHQSCIYLIKNTVKTVILWNITNNIIVFLIVKCFKIKFIHLIQNWIFSRHYSGLQCHMIFQKSFLYADLLSMLETVVVLFLLLFFMYFLLFCWSFFVIIWWKKTYFETIYTTVQKFGVSTFLKEMYTFIQQGCSKVYTVVGIRGIHGSQNSYPNPKRPVNMLHGTDPDPYFIWKWDPNPCRPEKCLKCTTRTRRGPLFESWTRTRLGRHRPDCTQQKNWLKLLT